MKLIIKFTEEFRENAKQQFLDSKCELYYDDTFENEKIISDIFSVSVDDVDDIYPDDVSRSYYFYCQPPDKRIPSHISFIPYNVQFQSWNHDVSGQPRKYIIPIKGNYNGIYNSMLKKSIKKNLMICIKPFYDIYNDFEMILNFFIIQIALGVQHFTIFDSGNINPKILKIIQSIKHNGTSISMLSYNYRERYGHIQHQSIQAELCLTDALFRGYENLMNIDVDEAFVPTIQSGINDLGNLLQLLDSKYPNSCGYQFHNDFFNLLFSPSENRTSNLISLKYVKNSGVNNVDKLQEYPFVNHPRTKCILKPKLVDMAYIHKAKCINNDYSLNLIPHDLATMHHYKPIERSYPMKEAHHYKFNRSVYSVPVLLGEKMINGQIYKNYKKFIEVDLPSWSPHANEKVDYAEDNKPLIKDKTLVRAATGKAVYLIGMYIYLYIYIYLISIYLIVNGELHQIEGYDQFISLGIYLAMTIYIKLSNY
jgi:hypothetical protein